MDPINERVKTLRIALGMTQDEFASHMGMCFTTTSKWELGTRNIADRNIVMICRTYNVRREWLLTGEGAIFNELDDEDEKLIARLADVYGNGSTLFRAIIRTYVESSPKDREAFESMLTAIMDNKEMLDQRARQQEEALRKATPPDLIVGK